MADEEKQSAVSSQQSAGPGPQPLAPGPRTYEITTGSVTFPTTTTVKDENGHPKAAPVQGLSYSAPHMVKGDVPQFVAVPQTLNHQMTMHFGHWLKAETAEAIALAEELVKKGLAKLKD